MVKNQSVTSRYALYHGDTCEVLPTIPDGSVHLSVHSPPFAGLFTYSSSERDLSNCRTYPEFLEHYEFVVRETARVTMPGRIAAVHCMDVPKDGANICGYTDFPGDIIKLYEKHGFEYTPRICIWKEPLNVRNRTMSKALAHCQIVEDAVAVNIAAADYLIPFRKKGKNPVPVTHPSGLLSYYGANKIPHELIQWRDHQGDQIENKFSHWIWRQYASCIWNDINGNLGQFDDDNYVATLPYKEARDENDERHIHPLQLDVIRRCVQMWSNPGEVCLSQFGGVGSEPYAFVELGRNAIAIELKDSYYPQMVRNVESALENPQSEQVDLFETMRS